MYTASFAFFEALWEAGVTHCFVNLGSDHPSILEALVKGRRNTPDKFPTIITCPNEMVALSAAHGMALVTGKPQAVIVHVDVGTQGLGAAVHNASCGRAPVLIFAGLSPFTQEGEMRGSRTEFIHYIQDVPDQGAIVRQYCRYECEIKTGKNIKQMIMRALQFATSDPKGPVYLSAAREVLEEEIEPYHLDQAVWDPVQPCALPESAVEEITHALLKAKNPLIITGYVGRNHEAVRELVKLADTLPVRVLDTIGSDMSFPAGHCGSLGLAYGPHPWITNADVIIVLDCDVPWIPTQCKPTTSDIWHLDVDPMKQQMPVFYISAKARFKTDAETALKQLNKCIAAHVQPYSMEYKPRFEQIRTEWNERQEKLNLFAQPRGDGKLSSAFVAKRLKALMPEDAVVCLEAVTQTVAVADQLKMKEPGSLFNSGAGGLGWYGGAALGVKLALDKGVPNSGRFVAAIVGDGTFLFAVPSSVYWMSRRYKVPFLTIVINNKGWNAPLRSALLVHPDGLASQATNDELCIEFSPSPDYAGIAKAAAGGEIWAGKAESVDELEGLMKEAIEYVKGGKSAVLEVVVYGTGV
ncbi:thiamine pyrophosphate enzyme, N-terminal TPP binding domain-containing protein [Peziza echinospora]|nr:thiamine pyrophosphate enzyme, N-terminal TPP binding domain-containing protein [Peziza echinospora]